VAMAAACQGGSVNDVMAAAIVAANGKLRNLPKTGTAKIDTRSGGSFSYSYTPLPDILDAVRPVLAKHGLALLQHVGGSGGEVGVETVLIHESGQEHRGAYVTLPATDPKVAGSVITYLRRYAICALFGIAGDDDLDSSPAVAPAAEQAASTDSRHSSAVGEAGGTTSASLGEAGADLKPGEVRPSSPGFPIAPEACDHKTAAGRWVKWKSITVQDYAGQEITREYCPKCGTEKLIAMESGGPYQ